MIAVCIYKNPYYDEKKKRALTFVSALLFVMAGAEGLEPSTTVLETGMLPLHYAPIQFIWWAFRDSNPKPTGYEPVALTN